MLISCHAIERIGNGTDNIPNQIDCHTYHEKVEENVERKKTNGIGLPVRLGFI